MIDPPQCRGIRRLSLIPVWKEFAMRQLIVLAVVLWAGVSWAEHWTGHTGSYGGYGCAEPPCNPYYSGYAYHHPSRPAPCAIHGCDPRYCSHSESEALYRPVSPICRTPGYVCIRHPQGYCNCVPSQLAGSRPGIYPIDPRARLLDVPIPRWADHYQIRRDHSVEFLDWE